MSFLTVVKTQLGKAANAAYNFVLDAGSQDGTMKISRGTLEGTTQDILTVSQSGTVKFPQNTVVFSCRKSNSQVVNTGGTVGPILFNTKAFDTKNCYDVATGRFTPTVAGYYQINFGVGGDFQTPRLFALLFKNGVVESRGNDASYISVSNGNSYGSCGSCVVYLNGSTDYLTVMVYTGASGDVNSTEQTYFSGFLIQPA